MRKLFPFEISVAIKDRPKSFQFITLALFSFCITVILVGTALRLAGRQQVGPSPASAQYAGIATTPVHYSIQK